MPLFSNRRSEEVIEEPAPLPEKKHSLFGSRHRSPSPSYTTRTSTSASSRNSATTPDIDPSIMQARERVMGAENAERDADRALAAARLRVREAQDEVKRLELEAAEDARRAKIKQYHAKEVSKRGKQLGRHGL
ncbi:hypothetical protein CIB48_g4048 [Xylaria polymorpha]|nr:hypothetical protein CIB48_g4048 [Xylaria polymorpha]